MQAHNERGRDYTIPEAGILPLQQGPGGAGHAAAGWQPPAAAAYPGAPPADRQMPPWDMSGMHPAAGRPPYGLAPSSGGFPSQGYPPPPPPPASAGIPTQQYQYPPGGSRPASSAEHPQGGSQQLPPPPPPPPYGRPTAQVVSQPPVYY